MKNKSTKHALLASVLSIVMCFAMLISSTFAWFTDEVKSGVNKIVAGNLDVELEYATSFDDDGNPTAWKSVEGATDLFSTDPVWEPGHTEVVILKIRNAGNLALKYCLAVESISDAYSYNVNNEMFYLSDYLVFNRTDDTQLKNREAYWNAELEDLVLNDGAKKSNPSFAGLSIADKDGDTKLNAGEEKIFSVAIYMPTSVGNEANWYKRYSWTEAPSIELGLSLRATQVQHEEDSFGPDYDADAIYEWDGKDSDTEWYNAEQTEFELKTPAALNGLKELMQKRESFVGKTVTLGADMDLKENALSISGFNGTFDGNGHEIKGVKSTLFTSPKGTADDFAVVKNLTVTGNTTSAMIASSPSYVTFENITVNGTVNATSKQGALISSVTLQSGSEGDIVKVIGCVNNASVNATTQAGGIIGYVRVPYIGSSDNTVLIQNCVNNGAVSANDYNGGILGYGANVVIKGCYNTGDVSAKNNLGGIVGNTVGTKSEIINCYNTGKVTATDSTTNLVGGIVGLDANGSLIVDSCYNTGKVSGGASNSGIVGNTAGTGDHYTKCYYLEGSADQGYGASNKPDTEGKYVAKTSEEMKMASTYVDWDQTVWSLTDGAYPTFLNN